MGDKLRRGSRVGQKVDDQVVETDRKGKVKRIRADYSDRKPRDPKSFGRVPNRNGV
ncbi:MAG TPA: hypothetical protein VF053_06250 [Streptosporangiales bacterium]